MSVIDSIERTFDGITIPVKGTDFNLRLIGGTVNNVIMIHETGELYKTHLDVKIFSHKVDELITLSKILKTRPILVIDFLDKHAFRVMDRFKQNDYKDYYFIQKEGLTEIKGGSYAVEQTIDKLQSTISRVLGGKRD